MKGTSPSQELKHVLFDSGLVFLSLDRLYRSSNPMKIGQRIKLWGLTVEVTALTDDGRPAEAAFRFRSTLEDPTFYWMEWEDGEYVRFVVPAVGERVRLPAPTFPTLRTTWSRQE